MKFHNKNIEESLKELESRSEGLSLDKANSRLLKYGRNIIEGKDNKSPITIFFKQFKNPLIYILFVAAIISLLFGKMIDAYVICAVIILNAIMGFIQEYKAERAILALKKMLVPFAKVYRGGELSKISSEEIVIGDVVLLEEGDRIPADMRIIESRNLRTMEASLTGESSPKGKTVDLVSENADLADRNNMGFMGTFVVGGNGKGVVVSTGNSTAFGSIARDIGKIERVGGHFEKKIATLAKQMSIFAFTGALFIFLVGYFIRDLDFVEVLLFTIAALVSGIPEGLPAILVIVLSIGASRMARRNAIIRSLPATETLGVTTHIITDKTGTLTQNTMNVRSIYLLSREIEVTGAGWEPKGDFYENGSLFSPLEDEHLRKLLHISAVCNSSKLIKEGELYSVVGDPTEASLIVLAEKAGVKKEIIDKEEKKMDDMPFSSKLKYRASIATLVKCDNKKEIYVIGAPEEILKRSSFVISDGRVCKMDDAKRKEIIRGTEEMTKKAMRTIALAYREDKEDLNEIYDEKVKNMVLVGVVGMIDPPRPEVKESLEKAREAGIRVIMSTGDHKGTALAISKEIGLIDENDNSAYTEQDLLNMNEKEFGKAVREVSVFARLTPHMKLRIAESLQKDGAVVAMTGDGVNDAPALKKADIGIAMGITGTDVAKEAGEIVLADDNFVSIVNAIEEGRIVFTNTRQTSSFLITTNFAEHATLISALLLSFPLPLLPTQILWLNLVTDGLFGSSLAFEPGHGDILRKKPRNKNENILTKEILPFFVLMFATMAVLTLFVFNYFLPEGLDKARTGAFTVMAFTQLFNALNMRSIEFSVFRVGFLKNRYFIYALIVAFVVQIAVIEIPFFQRIFHFNSLSAVEFIVIIVMSSSVFILGEIYKALRYKH